MKDIIDKLVKFRDERNWKQFHSPDNLAKSIVIEAAELLENYQWQSKETDLNNVKEEIADIMAYCLLLCDYYQIDYKEILLDKIKKNEEKYPVEKAYGKSDKYNKLI
jgi:NTP pyrophosphatase (non-canonical NTP hydrolase)